MAVRTIIFRGKRIDNGEWVEGSYCHAEKLDRSGDEHFIIEYSANGSSHRVDPSTVGQYTGLKDKNGRLSLIEIRQVTVLCGCTKTDKEKGF